MKYKICLDEKIIAEFVFKSDRDDCLEYLAIKYKDCKFTKNE